MRLSYKLRVNAALCENRAMNKVENRKLFEAIENNDWETIENILDIHPDEVDVYGFANRYCRDKTPLMYSLQCENFAIARKIIARGAKVDAKMSGGPESSVLALAANVGHGLNPKFEEWVTFVSELIGKGANPTDGLWPALASYKDGRAEMIKLLVENRADLDSSIQAGNIRELVKTNRQLYSVEILILFEINSS